MIGAAGDGPSRPPPEEGPSDAAYAPNAGTEPGTAAAAKKPMTPIIARRPF